MNKKVFQIVSIVVGILLLISLFTFASHCPRMEDGNYMRCYKTNLGLKLVSLAILLIGVLSFLKAERIKNFAILGVVVSLANILIIFIMGTCKNPQMRCNTMMKPFTLLLSAIYLIVSGIFIIKGEKRNNLS